MPPGIYSPASSAAAAAAAAMGFGVNIGMPHLSALPPFGVPVGAFPGSSMAPHAPPGSFQHLLASMTSAAAKAKHAHAHAVAQSHQSPLHIHTTSRGGGGEQSNASSGSSSTPSPPESVASGGSGTGSNGGVSGNVSPVEQDRRSSSIAVLRMKAREYEMKIQLGQKCVY